VSVLNDGAAFLKAVLGLKVSRPTAVLPATTQAAIFTIGTGRVIVTSLVGTFTVAGSATATTLQVAGNPASGTDVVLTTAVAVTSKEVGSTITMGATLGGALSVQNAGANAIPIGTGFILNPGTLDIITNATNTGSVKWDITYVPLDDGASITAA
jgi:hypothetical protein